MHQDYQNLINLGFSPTEMLSAGYFDSSYDPKGDLFKYLPEIKPEYSCIIAIAGCFSPFHEGHLDAILKAKQYYDCLGFNTCAVIYPAHDSYVSIKNGGAAALDINKRLHQIKLFTKKYDWITVDGYPALELKEELNFPYLIDRLEKTANKVKTCFVVGGDNAGFSYAMMGRATEICIISRDKPVYLDSSKINPQKVIFLDGGEKNISSSLKRSRPVYLIRDDSVYCGGDSIDSAGIPVQQKLHRAISAVFPDLDIVLFSAEEQSLEVSAYLDKYKGDRVVISADKWLERGVDYKLNISRFFSYEGSTELSSEVIINDPGFESFLKGINKSKEILVIDDDFATGSTLNKIKSVLIQHGFSETSISFLSMAEIYSPWGVNRTIYDIVDARDFIEGAKFGGLQIKDKGRILYTNPKIDLTKRMKLKPEDVSTFRSLML